MSAQGHSQEISQELALRIGMAARILPDTEPRRLVEVLVDALKRPLTEEKLAALTVQQLRTAGDGAFQNASLPVLKQAIDTLWGKQGLVSPDAAPTPEPYCDGDLPGSIRVAVASNSGEQVDGHFGSCSRFLVYQLSPEALRLIDVRRPGKGEGIDKNAARAEVIADCDLLYVMSIGGPAAAQVVKRDIHPVKIPDGGPARDPLIRTQAALSNKPPPWLARAMARTAG